MRKLIFIEPGQRFRRLVVLKTDHIEGRKYYICQCDCGNTTKASGSALMSGNTGSCGCLMREYRKSGNSNRTHGKRHSSEYEIWAAIQQRCKNPNNPAYPRYGGRGITVCERWKTFAQFLADVGERPDPSLTLDRIDNNGNYEPSNCQWATLAQQGSNKRNNRILTFQGKSVTLAEWSRITGIKRTTIDQRLNYGYSVEQALSLPVRVRVRKKGSAIS